VSENGELGNWRSEICASHIVEHWESEYVSDSGELGNYGSKIVYDSRELGNWGSAICA